MATQIQIDLLINASESAKTIGEAKKALKDLKSAALEVGEGAPGFNKIVNAAGDLNNKIGDLNRTVNILSTDFKGLTSITQIARGIASGFAVAQGAAALFGDKVYNKEAYGKEFQKHCSWMHHLSCCKLILHHYFHEYLV